MIFAYTNKKLPKLEQHRKKFTWKEGAVTYFVFWGMVVVLAVTIRFQRWEFNVDNTPPFFVISYDSPTILYVKLRVNYNFKNIEN